MDATRHLDRASSPTFLVAPGANPLERSDVATALPGRRRGELEAVGLLLGVVSILLALVVGLGVVPGN